MKIRTRRPLKPLLLASLFFLHTCNSEKESKIQVTPKSEETAEELWPKPDPLPSGAKLVVNEKLDLSSVKWLTPDDEVAKPFSLILLWKTNSPLSKLTLKKVQELNKNSEHLKISMVSEKAPRFEVRTNSLNKGIRFGVEEKSKMKDQLGIETYPQAYLTLSDGTVCWQGHPQNFSIDQIQRFRENIQ